MMNNGKETFWKKNKKVLFTAIISIVGLILIFNLFDGLLIKIWDNLVVNPILIPSDITSKELAIKWVFVLAPFLLIFKGDYQPPKWIIRTVLIMSVAYVYFTIWHEPAKGSFYSFQEERLSHIKYTDFFFMFTAMALFWGYREWIVGSEKSLVNKSIFSLEQLAEETGYSDDHKRDGKASLIADQILLIEYKQAFGIGIVGSWGSGKTYFISMITRHIKERAGDSTKLIHFTPWVNTENRSITELFLEKLSSEIEGEASKKVKEYSKKIFDTSSGVLSNLTSIQFSSESEVSTDDISNSIIKSGRKLIVVIDDIDRLNENEVIEVFRLIRNTANFSNTIYLVAYDRVYVDDILRKVSEDKNSEYLNKIIQFEYYLPQPKPQQLKDIFEKLFTQAVKRQFSERDANKLIAKIEDVLTLLPVSTIATKSPDILYFDDLITNTRDVHKITNSFLFGLLTEDEKSEIVNWEDLFWIEAIKLRSPFCYENIRTKKWLSPNKGINNNSYFYSVSLLDSDPELNKDEKVGKAIKTLFGNHAKRKSIKDVDYFDWYFESYSNILLPKERDIICNADNDEFEKLVFNELIQYKPDALTRLVEDIAITDAPFRKLLIAVSLLRIGKTDRSVVIEWNNLVDENEYVKSMSFRIYMEYCGAKGEEIIRLKSLLDMGLMIPIWVPYIKNTDVEFTERKITVENLYLVLFENSLDSNEISIEDKWELYKLVRIQKEQNELYLKPKYEESRDKFFSYVKDAADLEFIHANFFEYNIPDLYFTMNDNKRAVADLPRFGEIRLCSLSPEVIELFDTNINFIEGCIRKQPPSFKKEWLLFIFNKIKSNNFNEVFCEELCITYASSVENVRIERAKDNAFLKPGEFQHAEFSARNIEKHPFPALFYVEATCVTQDDEMTDNEAHEGGEYIYYFKFDLESFTGIRHAHLYGFVDDECKIIINNYDNGQTHYNFFTVHKIENYFQIGLNTIEIRVVNYSGDKINTPNATWKTNPYALRFLIVIAPNPLM